MILKIYLVLEDIYFSNIWWNVSKIDSLPAWSKPHFITTTDVYGRGGGLRDWLIHACEAGSYYSAETHSSKKP